MTPDHTPDAETTDPAPTPAGAEQAAALAAHGRRETAGRGFMWLIIAAAATAYFVLGWPWWALLPITAGLVGVGLLIDAVVGPSPVAESEADRG
ncbi:hypothetical protein ACQP25_44370 (plasmid) [Microtetraspora malaysiensis]|uniref:hypothetical protein n=1 Tax=Microtetraspora malaysiensis TaxID=161358 RepID=UPI003D8DC8DF